MLLQQQRCHQAAAPPLLPLTHPPLLLLCPIQEGACWPWCRMLASSGSSSERMPVMVSGGGAGLLPRLRMPPPLRRDGGRRKELFGCGMPWVEWLRCCMLCGDRLFWR